MRMTFIKHTFLQLILVKKLMDKYNAFTFVKWIYTFGFLMVFLKNNSWCSIGFNYLIACWAIQICILFTGFWHNIMHFYQHGQAQAEGIGF